MHMLIVSTYHQPSSTQHMCAFTEHSYEVSFYYSSSLISYTYLYVLLLPGQYTTLTARTMQYDADASSEGTYVDKTKETRPARW